MVIIGTLGLIIGVLNLINGYGNTADKIYGKLTGKGNGDALKILEALENIEKELAKIEALIKELIGVAQFIELRNFLEHAEEDIDYWYKSDNSGLDVSSFLKNPQVPLDPTISNAIKEKGHKYLALIYEAITNQDLPTPTKDWMTTFIEYSLTQKNGNSSVCDLSFWYFGHLLRLQLKCLVCMICAKSEETNAYLKKDSKGVSAFLQNLLDEAKYVQDSVINKRASDPNRENVQKFLAVNILENVTNTTECEPNQWHMNKDTSFLPDTASGDAFILPANTMIHRVSMAADSENNIYFRAYYGTIDKNSKVVHQGMVDSNSSAPNMRMIPSIQVKKLPNFSPTSLLEYDNELMVEFKAGHDLMTGNPVNGKIAIVKGKIGSYSSDGIAQIPISTFGMQGIGADVFNDAPTVQAEGKNILLESDPISPTGMLSPLTAVGFIEKDGKVQILNYYSYYRSYFYDEVAINHKLHGGPAPSPGGCLIAPLTLAKKGLQAISGFKL